MESKTTFKTISVKEDVHSQLIDAISMLNSNSSNPKKNTIARLIAGLAEAYTTQMTPDTITSTTESWKLDGVPLILTSDAAKHYREMISYFGGNAPIMVENFIRSTAMNERFSRIANGDK